MSLDPEVASAIDMAFVLICGFLCFLLQAGFGLLEVGSVRAKNAQNIMMKNIMDFCIGTLAFLAIGFHLMFAGPDESLFWLGSTSPDSPLPVGPYNSRVF